MAENDTATAKKAAAAKTATSKPRAGKARGAAKKAAAAPQPDVVVVQGNSFAHPPVEDSEAYTPPKEG